jgi:2-polyprenyl-3-methyl-5-hydroxy-6-metoxy-1,4-benzoquinol methylase
MALIFGQYFEAITAHHVIEHMHGPQAFLKECMRILRPDGILILTTPNINSLGHKIFNKYWRELDVPRHLYLFSTSSLKMFVENHGFRISQLRTTARSAWKYNIRVV